MPKVKSVLGAVSVETAKRRRICSRHRSGKAAHPIATGEMCLVVKNGDGGKNNYCVDAAEEILDLAATELAQLRSSLGL